VETPSFKEKVIQIVRGIPAGSTRTYKDVAMAAGQPRAYRAVGNILHAVWQTDHGTTIPCHRVVRSDGTPGGYAGEMPTKVDRLRRESLTKKE
jgi:O-6-methylguanine DNA methyltransferase